MRRNYRDGFTLLELMIVVAVILTLVAIAIPNLLRYRMNANEASAIQSVRMVATGEVGFQAASYVDSNSDGTGDFGTLVQLHDPQGNGQWPSFIDSVLASGSKAGYTFAVQVVLGDVNTSPSYLCTGVPSTFGRTGVRNYFVNETGVIRFTIDGSPAGAASTPLN